MDTANFGVRLADQKAEDIGTDFALACPADAGSSGSNLTLGARLTATMILSGSATHWKDFDWAL
jgi:hypothetical protein